MFQIHIFQASPFQAQVVNLCNMLVIKRAFFSTRCCYYFYLERSELRFGKVIKIAKNFFEEEKN